MMGSNEHRDDPLVMLSLLAGRLAGGVLEIGAFKQEFTNLEWEDRMASDASALRLGWDIQNILYQHDFDPSDVTDEIVTEEISDLVHSYIAARRPGRGESTGLFPAVLNLGTLYLPGPLHIPAHATLVGAD